MTEIEQNTHAAERSKLNRRKRPVTASGCHAATKMALVSKLLARARGASIAELGSATGWQLHSVRALLSGMRKKGVRLARETRCPSSEHLAQLAA